MYIAVLKKKKERQIENFEILTWNENEKGTF